MMLFIVFGLPKPIGVQPRFLCAKGGIYENLPHSKVISVSKIILRYAGIVSGCTPPSLNPKFD
jgi:hypothetical protein